MSDVNIKLEVKKTDGFSYVTDAIENILETDAQDFKVLDGAANVELLGANPIQSPRLIFIVADQDNLELSINTDAGSGVNSFFKLRAGKPCLIQCNGDIVAVLVSNPTGGDITGRFFAAGND